VLSFSVVWRPYLEADDNSGGLDSGGNENALDQDLVFLNKIGNGGTFLDFPIPKRYHYFTIMYTLT
jgi:hypothetical protein